MSALEELGQVASEYRHGSKLARPSPSVDLDGAILKWYDIAPADEPIPVTIRELARRNLHEAARSGDLTLSGDLGFVILHRCGERFYYLIASTWRNDNELWETVWAKDGDRDSAFHAWPAEGTHRPTFCVWELGAVCHERQAWLRFLRSPRDAEAKRAYLRDAYLGVV